MATRTSNTIIKKEDIDFLLNLNQKELESFSFMMETFGEIKGKRRFNSYDIVTIPPGSYGSEKKKNKNSFTTTVGLWVFNKCFIEQDLFDIFGYINEPITAGMHDKINTKISYAVLEDKISLEALKRWLMRVQKYQPYCHILCSGYSEIMFEVTTKIKTKKEALLKKYKKEIDAGNEKVIADIEKELLDYARDVLKDDPAIDIFDSGSKGGSFSNNFKNLFVMRGAFKNPDPAKGYEIISSNYLDGISKEDYTNAAKSLTSGPYARSKKTAIGGWWEKLFLRSFQHMKLLPAGSDCGTKRTITFTITKDNYKMIMYNYIVEGTKLVELTTDNIDKYIGKTVKMRFASLCENKGEGLICSKCAGNMFYRAGFTNVGTATPQLASKLKLKSMKAFHDSQVKLHTIDVAKAFEEE